MKKSLEHVQTHTPISFQPDTSIKKDVFDSQITFCWQNLRLSGVIV